MLRSLVLLLLAPALAPAQEPRITVGDLARVQVVADVELHDGFAVYAVRSVHGDPTDREDDAEYRTHLWRVGLDEGSTPVALTRGERGGRAPAISPDGRTLAFLRGGEEDGEDAGEDRSQVWLLPLDGPGEARQLTTLEHGAGSVAWWPDGSALLVGSALPLDEVDGTPPWSASRPGRGWDDVPELAEIDGEDDDADEAGDVVAERDAMRRWLDGWGDDDGDAPTTITGLDFQGERGLDVERSVAHLFRVDAESGEAARLTTGFVDHGAPRLSPDGATIAFVGRPPGDAEPDRVQRSALWLVDADGGNERPLADDPAWSFGVPAWAPEGGHLYATASETDEPSFRQDELVRVDAATGAWERLLPDLDRSVGDLRVLDAAEGELVAFLAAHEGAVGVHVFDSAAGAVREAFDPNRAVLAYAASGDAILEAVSDAANPCELFLHAEDGTRRLTDLHAAWLDGVALSAPEERRIDREDGTRVQYWVMPPVGLEPGAKAPTILSIHGGPQVMWGPGSVTMWHEWQHQAALGYGVVYANPRGSAGYGYAHQKGNFRDWGVGPAGDVLAALDAAAAEFDWIDSGRLFVTGGSYAGYLTGWIVTQDHRFRAAVAQRGVYHLPTFFGEGNAWRLVDYAFGGWPWEEDVRAVLEAQSPFNHVEAVETPLLILHASQDLRTGVSQSEMFYRALEQLEKPVEYVRYPGAGHDLSRTGDPSQRVDRLLRILEFFDRFDGVQDGVQDAAPDDAPDAALEPAGGSR